MHEWWSSYYFYHVYACITLWHLLFNFLSQFLMVHLIPHAPPSPLFSIGHKNLVTIVTLLVVLILVCPLFPVYIIAQTFHTSYSTRVIQCSDQCIINGKVNKYMLPIIVHIICIWNILIIYCKIPRKVKSTNMIRSGPDNMVRKKKFNDAIHNKEYVQQTDHDV